MLQHAKLSTLLFCSLMEDQTLSVCLFQKQMQAMAQKYPVHHFSYCGGERITRSSSTKSITHCRQHSGLVLSMGWALQLAGMWFYFLSSEWLQKWHLKYQSAQAIMNPSLVSSAHNQTSGRSLFSPELLCWPCSATQLPFLLLQREMLAQLSCFWTIDSEQ